MNCLGNTILLVEDNADDVYALTRALKKALIANPVQTAADGREAIEYLAGSGRFADRKRFPQPFLIFLDLKLPYRDGFEVLEWIKNQTALDSVPVVVLTGSDETRDHEKAYALGARSYLVKPAKTADIEQLVHSLQSYWTVHGSESPIIRARDELNKL